MSPWSKLDDRFDENPKIAAASDRAFRTYVCSITFSSRNETDGFIPGSKVRGLADVADPDPLIAELVRLKLWEEAPGGFRIHDYLEYNLSRAQLRELRDQRARAGSLGGKRSGEVRAAQAEASAEANASAKAEAKSNPIPSPVARVPNAPVPGPSGERARARSEAKRAEQVPENWQPSDDDREWAASQGFNATDVQHQTLRFIRWHRSKGNTFVDVSGSWRNWMDDPRSRGPASAQSANGQGRSLQDRAQRVMQAATEG